MTDTARVRISKVRFHDGRELVILKTPDPYEGTRFCKFLVEVLAMARAGEVKAYAVGFVLPDDRISGFGVTEDHYKTELIGVLDVLKMKIARESLDYGEWDKPVA